MPTPTLKGLSPLQVLLCTPPQYSSLKVCGCACFPNIRNPNQHKLEFRSIECTCLGCSLNHKGFKCLDPTGKIIISRNVIFDETSFRFAKMEAINISHTSSNTTEDIMCSPSTISCSKVTKTPTLSFLVT